MKEPIEVDILQSVTGIVKEDCPYFQSCKDFKAEISEETHSEKEVTYFLKCKGCSQEKHNLV